jgi:hypothetical protein
LQKESIKQLLNGEPPKDESAKVHHEGLKRPNVFKAASEPAREHPQGLQREPLEVLGTFVEDHPRCTHTSESYMFGFGN